MRFGFNIYAALKVSSPHWLMGHEAFYSLLKAKAFSVDISFLLWRLRNSQTM